ncbi:unnamed protein product [Toxocara canis]|uniref:Uncharacterized protein n=1 Tax=Toxocara canis TaxID=6265 RepID=A0A183UN55_TOXCA|nr:unnamed protein product [Toxocara canis]
MSSMMRWRRMCERKQTIGARHTSCMVRDAKDAKPVEIEVVRWYERKTSRHKNEWSLEVDWYDHWYSCDNALYDGCIKRGAC